MTYTPKSQVKGPGQAKAAQLAVAKPAAPPTPATGLTADQVFRRVSQQLPGYRTSLPTAREPLLRLVSLLKACGQREQLTQMYEAAIGRPLLADLARGLRNLPVAVREQVRALYNQPLKAHLSFDAFAEQLAISAA